MGPIHVLPFVIDTSDLDVQYTHKTSPKSLRFQGVL